MKDDIRHLLTRLYGETDDTESTRSRLSRSRKHLLCQGVTSPAFGDKGLF
jgi:hypothetical protein